MHRDEKNSIEENVHHNDEEYELSSSDESEIADNDDVFYDAQTIPELQNEQMPINIENEVLDFFVLFKFYFYIFLQ